MITIQRNPKTKAFSVVQTSMNDDGKSEHNEIVLKPSELGQLIRAGMEAMNTLSREAMMAKMTWNDWDLSTINSQPINIGKSAKQRYELEETSFLYPDVTIETLANSIKPQRGKDIKVHL